MFCVNIFFLWGRVGKEGGEGWLGEGYVSVCVLLGGGVLTNTTAGLHTRKITIVCEISCMTIIQYPDNKKAL